MKTRSHRRASPLPTPLVEPAPQSVAPVIDQPAGNATRLFETPRVRRRAQAEQATLQKKGANALPVSDYPLKVGPVAANGADLRERRRSRA